MSINVALDGPSGAGKSTIAKAAAQKLKYLYVDTGAMYRAVALYVLSNGKNPDDENEVELALDNININLIHTDEGQRIILNGEDVSDKIRTPEISMAASKVSAIPKTREFLLSLQKNIAKENNVIMDGRDIGTVVLPQAQVKIFLTASSEERARRRYEELIAKGEKVEYEDILRDINERDYNDTHREIAPLKKADDAIEIDSTSISLEAAIDKIVWTIKNVVTKDARYETPQLRPVIKGKKTPLWKRIAHEFLRLVAKAIYYTYLDLHFEGVENVPKDGSNIFASNHRSYTDSFHLSRR